MGDAFPLNELHDSTDVTFDSNPRQHFGNRKSDTPRVINYILNQIVGVKQAERRVLW